MPEPDITYVTDPFKGTAEVRTSQDAGKQDRVQQRDTTLQKNDEARMNAMPKQSAAFLEGFVIKCAEAGITEPDDVATLLQKTADPNINTTLRDLLMHPLTASALGGLLGAGGGYAMGFDPLLSGLVGTGIGYGISDKSIPGRLPSDPPAE